MQLSIQILRLKVQSVFV